MPAQIWEARCNQCGLLFCLLDGRDLATDVAIDHGREYTGHIIKVAPVVPPEAA
jgi:hypothetical protein